MFFKKPARILFALMSVVLVSYLLYFLFISPVKTQFNHPVSSVLLDQQGKLLGAHIATDQQWRFPLIENVPSKFSTALIEYEDKRFHEHSGIDFLAMIRALKLNLEHGKIVSGASTLTMQVIRLSRENPKRTLDEKIKEMFLAIRLEIDKSKEDILRLYATHAPFGGNIVGLETASWRYFGRSPDQLSWAESATLAVLPNSPGLIHPGRQQHKLKIKRDALLKKMKDKHLIDPLSYDLAIKEPLPDKPKPLPRQAAHLLDTLNSENGSQRFVTTLDKNLQTEVNKVVHLHAQKLKLQAIHNVAALVIDNRTFEVKTYIGNSSNHQTGSQGHAIDLVRRSRSSGSTLKPLLFANMIEAGEILPETLIADIPVRYAGLRPENYDRSYRGAVRAKQALARSLNIPAANMLSQYGVGRFQTNLKNMGMSTLHRHPKNYGLALILGGAESTLWEITSLYANLAKLANLKHTESMIHWLDPVVLNAQKPATFKRVNLSTASSWMTLQALLEVTRPGTDGYWRKFSSSRKIAWKTGTSVGHRDAWAIGVTPDYTVGVWVGNAKGIGIAELTGVKSAAPLLFEIFNQLPQASNNQWFEKPHWQMKTINVCKKDGYLAVNGCDRMAYEVPVNSFFDKISPYHQRLHLDRNAQWQVHSRCEPISRIQPISWFILPPAQAHYYQQNHASYKPVPPFRSDCRSPTTAQNTQTSNNPISITYPTSGTHIYIPTKLDGKPSKTVFRAIHRRPESRLYWHIDHEFLGSTQTFHELAVWVSAGKHQLTIVDGEGNTQEQVFTVLEADNDDSK